MTMNELIFDVAIFGSVGCGSFEKITELGYDNEEQFLKEISKSKGAEWSYYDDGRKVMTIPKIAAAGWDSKFVVLNGHVATYNYAEAERLLIEGRKPKKQTPLYCDHYDDDDDEWYSEDYHDDYGPEDDLNDDYGWWR